jgi:DNA-binding phage protein
MMKGACETFSRYDTAGYLKTEADITAYLETCAGERRCLKDCLAL